MTAGGVTRSAPGKLYIAGEYAVVEPGHRAVLVAVDRFITARVAPAEHAGRISTALHGTCSRTWYRRPEDGAMEVEERAGDHVVPAIRLVEQMVREAGGPLRLFDLDVSSELDDGGRKLGLGSSAAVTVATVRAVAGFHDLPLNDLAVYKLALLANESVQPIGSGGDIAASAFTGWIDYTSPDRRWLRRTSGRTSVGELVRMDWPCLGIRRLEPPSPRLRVGWTGEPASTPRLVAGVRARTRGTGQAAHAARTARTAHAAPAYAAYAAFLRASESCVGSLARALREDDGRAIAGRIEESRRLLSDLSRTSGIVIETPRLRRLVDIARGFGASAKSSGAGGGDCGIALCPPGTDADAMCSAWEASGIRPLDLSVHSRGEAAS